MTKKYYDWKSHYEGFTKLPVGVELTSKEIARQLGIPAPQTLARLNRWLNVGVAKGWFHKGSGGPGGQLLWTRVGKYNWQQLEEAIATADKNRFVITEPEKVLPEVPTEVAHGSLADIEARAQKIAERTEMLMADATRLNADIKAFVDRVIG